MNCKMNEHHNASEAHLSPLYIQDYLEAALDPVEKIIIEEHLKNCETCRRELSEMKLLFWELEELKEDKIALPFEVSKIRSKVINEYFEDIDSGRYGLREYIKMQKQVYEKAGLFLNFIPGIKPGASYIQKGIKKAPSLLYKTLGNAFIAGTKLALARSRV